MNSIKNHSSCEECNSLKVQLQQALEQIAWFKRQIFGARTERFVPADSRQISLPLDLPAAATNSDPVQTISVPAHDRKAARNNNHPGRDEIPADLPRVVITIEPDFDTTGMEHIGDKIVERLEYQETKLFVNRYVSPIFRVVKNGYPTLINSPAPVLCIEKGKIGASIIAHAMLSKCEDHLPIYRIAKMFNRDIGPVIAESTLRDAFRQGADLLSILSHRMREIAQKNRYQQMDESTIKVVIAPSQGKSHQGYMIVSHAPPEKIILFDYQKTRNVDRISTMLNGFSGILQTDGLELYPPICKKHNLKHAGCMDHCRRNFIEAIKNHKDPAQHALGLLQQLYAVEREARDAGMTFEHRLELRQQKSRPVFDQFIGWCKQAIERTPPKSPIGKAIIYTLNRTEELGFFLEDGMVELSNILIENGIRPLAVGRKNFLMTGSEPAARRLATVYSIVGTCNLHKVNSRKYLEYVLNQLPARTSKNIDDLLPWNFKA